MLGLGKRTSFYDRRAFRDMVVTHLFQILAFTAMETSPRSNRRRSVKKNKVFAACYRFSQTTSCADSSIGYRAEEGVHPESDTETFIALKCHIDNWRWAGVPFLPAYRQAPGRRSAHHLDRLSRTAKSMFPADSGLASQGPDHLTFDLADA